MEENPVKPGKLIVISGPSGVGKGTVRQRLFAKKDLNLVYSVSYTTRLPRNGETNGVDYFFVTKAEFEQLIAENKFLEWTSFVGNYYGTPVEYVDQVIASGKNIILEIEIEGAKTVLEKRPNALSIFLLPPSITDLEQRIRQRQSEDEDIIQQRLDKAIQEIAARDKYQHVVINDSLVQVTNKIARIIRASNKT